MVFISLRNVLSPGPGERHQVGKGRFGAQTAAHPFDENFHAVPGCDEPGYQCFNALERAMGNPDILARLQSLIDFQKFIFVQAGFNFADQFVGQKAKAISELQKADHAWCLSDAPVESRIIESSKKVPRKHRFHEPDWTASGLLSKTQAGTADLHFGVLTQANCCEMFPLGLGPQAEPKVKRPCARNFSKSQEHDEWVAAWRLGSLWCIENFSDRLPPLVAAFRFGWILLNVVVKSRIHEMLVGRDLGFADHSILVKIRIT
jgi:hypothetical protein